MISGLKITPESIEKLPEPRRSWWKAEMEKMTNKKMRETPETDKAWQAEVRGNEEHAIVLVNLCAKLERERDEAQKFAEEYRKFWELIESAMDDYPNGDPLPWETK